MPLPQLLSRFKSDVLKLQLSDFYLSSSTPNLNLIVGLSYVEFK